MTGSMGSPITGLNGVGGTVQQDTSGGMQPMAPDAASGGPGGGYSDNVGNVAGWGAGSGLGATMSGNQTGSSAFRGPSPSAGGQMASPYASAIQPQQGALAGYGQAVGRGNATVRGGGAQAAQQSQQMANKRAQANYAKNMGRRIAS